MEMFSRAECCYLVDVESILFICIWLQKYIYFPPHNLAQTHEIRLSLLRYGRMHTSCFSSSKLWKSAMFKASFKKFKASARMYFESVLSGAVQSVFTMFLITNGWQQLCHLICPSWATFSSDLFSILWVQGYINQIGWCFAFKTSKLGSLEWDKYCALSNNACVCTVHILICVNFVDKKWDETVLKVFPPMIKLKW